MANNTIKIDGDFTSITKGFANVLKQVNELGKKTFGLNVDDKQLRKAQQLQKDIIVSTQKEIQRLGILMSSTFDDRRVKKFRDQIKELKNDLRDAHGTLSDLSGGRGGGIEGGGGRGGGAFGGFAGKAAIAGAAYQTIKGAIGMIIGPAMQAATSRLQLRGLGASGRQIQLAEQSGVYTGYSVEETHQQAGQMMRATGGMGQLGKTQMFSRAIGANPAEIIGMMGQMRGAGLSDKDSLRVLKETFSDAVASGFDHARAVDVLSMIASNTAAMAQQGDVNVEGMKSGISMLMQSSSFFKENPQRAMGALGGLNQMMTGSGPAFSMAFRAISEMPQYKNTSFINRMYETKKGIFKGATPEDTIQKTQAMITQLAQGYTGKTIKPGGGTGQLTEEEKQMFGLRMAGETGMPQEANKALLEAVLTNKGILDAVKGTKTIDEQFQNDALKVLDSSDGHLKVMEATLNKLQIDVSTLATNINNIIDPTKGVGKFMSYLNPISGISGSLIRGMGGTVARKMGMTKTVNGMPASPDVAANLGVENDQYDTMIDNALKSHPNVPKSLVKSLIQHESGLRPGIMSGTGATGLGQATQGTWNMINPMTGMPFGEGTVSKSLGTFRTDQDPRRDPQKNLNFVTSYLDYLLQQSGGDRLKAIQGYVDPKDRGAYAQGVVQKSYQLDISPATTKPNKSSAPDINTKGQGPVLPITKEQMDQLLKEKQGTTPAIVSELSRGRFNKFARNRSQTGIA